MSLLVAKFAKKSHIQITISHKLFDTNSSFHVKWHTTGKV